jgi:lysine-ketoglutarate reductase/saccharopine dehydrogenase-like protein (TIGR00300 family)
MLISTVHDLLTEVTMDPLMVYQPPDFDRPPLCDSPCVRLVPAPADGIAPELFHATSNFPEYVNLAGYGWTLAPQSRMDAVIVVSGGSLAVIEPRRLRTGDLVVVGRSENGEEGIFVHPDGFRQHHASADKFIFRSRGTRETPFSRSYDDLYRILRHDREHGAIVWVLGPAVSFDKDSRNAMQGLIESGYCHALLAGNALATHDLEAARFGTGLGQDIYNQQLVPLGHYHHLDVIGAARAAGSIKAYLHQAGITDGIMHACEKHAIPYVLAGSIRDDGPLPGVIGDAYGAQDAMREHARRATTVIAMATQLHAIAFGNMVPSYRVEADGTVRPVFFFIVDMSEFSADKLANRGSAQAQAILTNAQDFIVNLWNNLQT